ncbi:hypothetical protein IPG41_05125 [Candidatus Peregrinibacteria bacterium]|nr:MAG: hypothetical protein IPG41_05125 [Candidatus Peregrinibacteria bacterium]
MMKKLSIFLSLFTLILSACNTSAEVSISHAHGLAVDSQNSNRVLIATHQGLLSWEDGILSQVGTSQSDLMGFTPHPSQENTYYSSGHPQMGSNLGFQKTSDGGENWELISLGSDGPVDFHAMTINSKDPNVVYGWYHGALQRSLDGGGTWEVLNTTLSEVITLNGTADDPSTVYAGTSQGLLVSTDKGETWGLLSEDLMGSVVIALAVNPTDSMEMLSFSGRLGLAKSTDGGKTWNSSDAEFGQDFPLYIAYSKTEPSTIYLLTKENKLYRSVDGGDTWNPLES